MTSRKSKAVKVLAILLVIPLVGAVAAYLWINRIADRRWDAAQERIRQLVAAYPEADARRIPETITPASRENQIHLVAAIRLAAPKRRRFQDASNLISTRKRGEERDALLDEAQDFLDRLHEGGRRMAASPADFPPRWHGDWDDLTLTYMMHCAILRARQQRDGNAPFDAAETLLDCLQLARFWAISGKGLNRVHALYSISGILEELRFLFASESYSVDQLERVERELEPLDHALQSPLRDLEPELARWAESLASVDLGRSSRLMEDAPFRWKYVLPARLMKAEALEFSERQVRTLLEAEQKPYSELIRRCRVLDEERISSLNTMIRKATIFDSRRGWAELDRKAKVRLLRIAVRYRATGEILELGDPFGTGIRRMATPTGMKFWSLGYDGTDEAGDAATGNWWFAPLPPTTPIPGVPSPSNPPVGRDLVIEVPRRP